MLLTLQFRTFFSSNLSKNVKIKMYETTILLFLYRYETWSLTLREEHRLRVFEKRMLRRIFELKTDEVMEAGDRCIMRTFIICTLNHIPFG
jgi:hypothetical protein